MSRRSTLEHLSLQGLTAAPSQISGALRLVPLLRERVRNDLRLAKQSYGEPFSVVSLGGAPDDRFPAYSCFIPHGLIVSWSDDGEPAAAYGTQLWKGDGSRNAVDEYGVRLLLRMARRVEPNRLRFLPLHVAMEGYLALHFGGPDVAWSEYSRRVLATGLSPRWEIVSPGREISGLEEALRVFEIHEGQVGVLLFVADALASAFVTPHPDDYRLLHRTLLEDFYGELIYLYSLQNHDAPLFETPMHAERVSSLADLRAELERVRREWSDFQLLMSGGISDCRLHSERVYRMGPFQLERFMTDLLPGRENHIGEAIVREDGTLEYLKSYRLSESQIRRAYLLKQLAGHHWNLEATAVALHSSTEELIVRLEKAGFGYLLHEHVLTTAQKRLRTRK